MMQLKSQIGKIFAISFAKNVCSSNISNETCENYNDGEISVNVSGGIPSYSYVWSNAVNSSINTNLSQGEYILNAFDDNNCVANFDLLSLPPEFNIGPIK